MEYSGSGDRLKSQMLGEISGIMVGQVFSCQFRAQRDIILKEDNITQCFWAAITIDLVDLHNFKKLNAQDPKAISLVMTNP
jgi:hypothetical protein